MIQKSWSLYLVILIDRNGKRSSKYHREKPFAIGIMDKIIGNTRSCVRDICVKENTGRINIDIRDRKAVWSCSEDR